MNLEDSVALITGASRGLGLEIARLYADRGARLVIAARGAESLQKAAAELRRKTEVVTLAADVSQEAERLVEAGLDRFGRIDVLVNNSGVIRDNLLGLLEDDDVKTVLDTNVVGIFNVTRAVVTHMISRRAGKIINVSSVAGEKGGRGQTNYAASKGAINAFTKALAVEVAPRGITVNAVAPGVIETDMSRDLLEQAPDEVKSRILLRRVGTPKEVAYAIMFLASRYADYITGQILHVDGGFKME